jgi:hypothetical protein
MRATSAVLRLPSLAQRPASRLRSVTAGVCTTPRVAADPWFPVGATLALGGRGSATLPVVSSTESVPEPVTADHDRRWGADPRSMSTIMAQ